MEYEKIDIDLVMKLYPKPRPSEPSETCGYCVGGALMAFLDGITAAMADDGHKPDFRKHYFPGASELAAMLQKINPELSPPIAERYAEFITRLNDRRRFVLAWGYLREALDWKQPNSFSGSNGSL